MTDEIDRLCVALGLTPSPAQSRNLLKYLDLLLHWNATYNLTAVRERPAMLTQHLADCLAVVRPVQCVAALGACRTWGVDSEKRPQRGQFLPDLQAHSPAMGQKAGEKWTAEAVSQPTIPKSDRLLGRLLDVGSGGGLPGVLLAIMLPALEVTCVDSVGKKAAFIRQAAATLGLQNLHAAHARVEALAVTPFDLITSRAFASLTDFTNLSRNLLAPGACWMAMKGKRPDAEIAALPPGIEVFHVEPLLVPGLDAERCLVWMRLSTQPTPS